VRPEDRDRVATAFTEAIRKRDPVEIAYRKNETPGEAGWLIAFGMAAENDSEVQYSGIEISPPPGMLADDGAPAPLLNRIDCGPNQEHAFVKDLVTYTSLSHQQPLTQELVDLDSTLDAALVDFEKVISDSGARITRSPLPSVLATRAHMVLLFENLISNAIKYTPKGVAPSIAISARCVSSRWRITVRDEGSGFSPEFSEAIFEPFCRLQGSSIPGTGIGLAICRRIVESYGGRMWAESQPDQGASFHFTLPAAPEPSSPVS
jgi:light-regulated signal transduction histidine kinase (bacteriophytochrome)